ncbi:hypothetical protein QFC22_005503 [Naganishia vaughanmartiniae]|uniref:Uncharacterized protein n=1 Tax=Naganishia vaughanmartiniae TaxID=1424756 RepID=A0ACC2WTY3_9TREE|nr:hypothetical protein QFC22_005503 [Naganishia vaughanmartiniae]
MLLTELILSKDTALSQVWIAAHYERKLSKQQALRISVQESVHDILKENIEPTALRMSGQLMLGVVRIYSRKTQYLFDDCKDVRDKITMASPRAPLAFRPGQVDLPPDQLNASKSAITITASHPSSAYEYTSDFSGGGGGGGNDTITLNMTWQEIAKNFQPLGLMQHLANEADINLPNRRPHYAASARSSSVSRDSEYGGSERGGGRAGTVEPFEQGGIDLGLDFGDITTGGAGAGAGDGDVSIEYGREAGVERAPSIPPSIASGMRMGSHRASSVLSDQSGTSGRLGGSVLGAGEVLLAARQGRDGEEGIVDEGPGDLGLDLGEGFDLPPLEDDDAGQMMMDVEVDLPPLVRDEGENEEARARARRESTGLSTPPPEDLNDDTASIMAEITPRTANRIAQMALTREKAATRKSALAAAEEEAGGKKKTVRISAGALAAKNAIDDDIEMDDASLGRGSAGRRDVSSILGKENYISANEAEIALERIQADPAAFYNPTVQVGNQTFFMATPAGIQMADELKAVFMIPTNILRRRRAEGGDGASPESRKRARLAPGEAEGADEDDEAIEAARRVQRGLSERFPPSEMQDHPMGDVTFGTDAGLDVSAEPGGFDDLPLEMGDVADEGQHAIRGRSVTPALSVTGTARERLAIEARSVRAGSIAPSISGGDAMLDDCPIGFFDARHRVHGAPVTDSQVTSSQAGSLSQYAALAGTEGEASQADARQRGYSQNTVKAAAFLRSEFTAEDGQVEEGKTISFQEKAKNASKRAASSFFFELLVLGTRDCITLDQPERYGDISVQAKSKLFEVTSGAVTASQAVQVAA